MNRPERPARVFYGESPNTLIYTAPGLSTECLQCIGVLASIATHVSEIELFQKKEKKTSLRKSGVDGIIAHIPNKEVAEELIPRGCPAVVIPANEIIPGLPNLAGDKDRAGELAAEHLLNIGLRHFAFCGYDPNYWSRERYHGFQKRIGQAGYNVHTFHQAKPQSMRIWENEQGPIANWLQSLPKPVGVWVWNDDLAEYVIEACKISGLVVPDDVCILGADNDDLVCSMCEPLLSSVAFNFEKAGYEIAELLHKLMKGEKVRKSTVTLHTTHIVTRQSTNTLALQNRDVAEAVRYIYANAHKPIQVRDVLSAVTVSRRVLYERFEEVLGRPVYEEIMRVRAERIVRLLVDTNLPISKIAQDLGFPGAEHISRYFKKTKGMSPRQYRKKYGQA